MESYPIDIIIPVYNEGENIKKVLHEFQNNVHTKFRILVCYDYEEDTTLKAFEPSDFNFKIIKLKNDGIGVHSAVITGMNYSNSDCVIVFPADDFINQKIIDNMYMLYTKGCDVVVASRFMKGGSMVGCPPLKSFIVRTVSKTLFSFSSIPVQDASNGFRLFSRRILNTVEIESRFGFTYSIELLVKCKRLGWKIGEFPAQWEERSKGKSKFQIVNWAPSYIRWYLYGLASTWLFKSSNSVRLK